MKPLLALAHKDLLLLLRDKSAVIWVLIFPLVIGVMFGFIFGSDNKMAPIPLAIVDRDHSATSRALVKELGKSKALQLESMELDAAKGQVAKGKKAAFLLIPKGYGEFDPFERIPSDKNLSLGADPSRRIENGMLEGIVQGAAMQATMGGMNDADSPMRGRVKESLHSGKLDAPTREFMQSLDRYLDSPKRDTSQNVGEIAPIRAEAVSNDGVHPANSFEVTFTQALIWGVLGVVTTFAISLVKERQQGTLLRISASPMSPFQILGGKSLACFVAVEGIMVMLLLVGHFGFHVRLGNVPLLALALLATGVAFVGIMMLLSTLGKTEQAVSGAGWGVMMLLAMFGGGMLPLSMMPGWMRSISDFSPLKWTALAVEGAIWRGFSLGDMLPPVAILFVVGVSTFLLGVKILSRYAPA